MGKAVFVSRNLVHLLVSNLCLCQAQQYLVPLEGYQACELGHMDYKRNCSLNKQCSEFSLPVTVQAELVPSPSYRSQQHFGGLTSCVQCAVHSSRPTRVGPPGHDHQPSPGLPGCCAAWVGGGGHPVALGWVLAWNEHKFTCVINRAPENLKLAGN